MKDTNNELQRAFRHMQIYPTPSSQEKCCLALQEYSVGLAETWRSLLVKLWERGTSPWKPIQHYQNSECIYPLT